MPTVFIDLLLTKEWAGLIFVQLVLLRPFTLVEINSHSRTSPGDVKEEIVGM